MQKKVSVVIPAYNHERFVGKAVESVLQQTYEHLELIVIDDGSTDQTGSIVKSYGSDPRLTYVYQENQDAYNALNRGLSLVQGDYVAILNSDDIYARNRLETLVQNQEQTGAHCLFSDVVPIDDGDTEFTDPQFGWNLWHKKNRDFYFSCQDLYTAFLKGNFMVTTSNLFLTREAADRVGGFAPLRYLHDYDYIFRVLLSFPGQVRYLDQDKLLFYRIHGGNTLGEAAIIGREQDQDVIKKYLLARIPSELQALVSAGSDRLVELEQELFAVRTSLAPTVTPGLKQQVRCLLRTINTRLFK